MKKPKSLLTGLVGTLFLFMSGSIVTATAKSEEDPPPSGDCYHIAGFPLLGKCYDNTEGGRSCLLAQTPMDCDASGKD